MAISCIYRAIVNCYLYCTEWLRVLGVVMQFPTIDNKILLLRLENFFGVKGTALQWFTSYLSGRSFHTAISNVNSHQQDVPYGVPHGSVLGPILFTLYTSPLASIIRAHNLKYHFYADDTQLYLSLSPKPDIIRSCCLSIETCLSQIMDFMNNSMRRLNDSKTEFIMFGSPFQLRNIPIIPSIGFGSNVF